MLNPDKTDGCPPALEGTGGIALQPDEIRRLRRAIQRTYGSSPHKKKIWLALLELQAKLSGSQCG